MSDTTPATVTTAPSQFSIRLPHWGWFMLATAVLVIGFVGLSVWLPWHREQQVIRMIEIWGGGVDTGTAGPEWLRHLMGEDRIEEFKVFNRIIGVRLSRTKITDVEIAHLSGLTNLRYLWLSKTAVTDAGLVHLSGCTNLEFLHLDGTSVTDAGLIHLRGCTHLESLGLSESVTDDGLTHLRGLTNLRRLGLNRTGVTDSGLTRLIVLKNLETLWIDDTAVTENGIEELRIALPKCEIRR